MKAYNYFHKSIKVLHCYIIKDQVKLFKMLQDEQENYTCTRTTKREYCTTTITITIIIIKKHKNLTWFDTSYLRPQNRLKSILCGRKAFQVYFDDAKDSSQESRVRQVSRFLKSCSRSSKKVI